MVDETGAAVLKLLREVRLLQPLKEAELAQLVQLGEATYFEEHANIVIEGEMSWGLFVILEGIVGIFKHNKMTGEPYDVGQLKQGNFFGEMSLVDENPRSATVKALTHVRVFYVSKENFHKFLSQSQDLKVRFYQACVHTMVNRLRELDDNYVISQYQLWKVALKKEAS